MLPNIMLITTIINFILTLQPQVTVINDCNASDKKVELIKNISKRALTLKYSYNSHHKRATPFTIPIISVIVVKNSKRLAELADKPEFVFGRRVVGRCFLYRGKILIVDNHEVYDTLLHEIGHYITQSSDEMLAEGFIEYYKENK